MSAAMYSSTIARTFHRYITISSVKKSSATTHIVLDPNFDHVNKEDDAEWNSALPYDRVPGLKAIPLLGNNWRFLPFVGDFEVEHIDKVCKRLYHEYGPCVKIDKLMGRPDMLFVFDPNSIEKVFRSEDHMPHRPSMPSLNYYKHVLRKDFFGENAGVIAVHGEAWNRFRSKVQQTMLQPRTAKLYIKQIEEAAVALVDRSRRIRSESDQVPDDFLNELHKWSLESIANVALDAKLGCFDAEMSDDTQQLIDAVNDFFKLVPILELKVSLWRLFSTPNWRKYINALDTITRITMRYVEAAMNQDTSANDETDLSVLQRLLRSNSGDPRIAVIMAFDLFLVGIDTTSNTVASILYQLSQHQHVQEKLYQEILNALPERDSPLTAAKLDSMSYLKACIKETLRMYPTVIGNGRCLTKNTVINGYQIPKGTQVIFQHYVISNLDDYFPDSSKFLPERWLKNHSTDGNGKKGCEYHAFASLPFGYGKRMCLGRRFAELEIQTVICKMIQSYKVEYNYPKLDYFIHPMYTPDGPLKFHLKERSFSK